MTETIINVTEKQIGNTLFTVNSVQSENAKETAYEKIKRLIANNVKISESYQFKS